MASLADLLRLNDGQQAYTGYPQMQVGLTKPRQAGYATGFLEGVTGADSMQPKNPITDPNYDAYAQGKNTGELVGIGAMALPAYAMALKASAPKAAQMVEKHLTNIGGINHIVPPRKELIEQQLTALEDTGRAKAGGQVADVNGFFYKGGQFLPNTNAEPGKWKIDKKWVKSSNELVEPGVRANGPTPFSRSIYGPMREFVEHPNNDFSKVKLKEGMKTLESQDGYQSYVPVTAQTTWTPRLADYEHHTPVTIGELIDAYNKGQRWFDVKPDAVTITTK